MVTIKKSKIKTIIKSMKKSVFAWPKGETKIVEHDGLYYLSVGKKHIAIMGPNFMKSIKVNPSLAWETQGWPSGPLSHKK